MKRLIHNTAKVINVTFAIVISTSLVAMAMTVTAGGQTNNITTLTTDVKMDIDNVIAEVVDRNDRDFFLYNPEDYKDEFCLAQNIFFEAGVDNKAGMIAVADVTLNRVEDYRYPDTICEVVYQAVLKESWKTAQYPDLDDSERVYIPVRNKCQFSWYCDGKSDDIPKGSENWVKAQTVAWEMLHSDNYIGLTEGATHYHATYVKPYWRTSKNMNLVGRIGAHIFYRWD